MITVNGILWAPIETMPSDRRDGRTMLLWADGDAIRGRWAANPPGMASAIGPTSILQNDQSEPIPAGDATGAEVMAMRNSLWDSKARSR